jgi:hypothetical protein
MKGHPDLLWVDISASIKTLADLLPGDVLVEGGTKYTRAHGVSQVRGNDVIVDTGSYFFADRPLGKGWVVLRRWDRLEKLPYTVVLIYVNSDAGPAETFLGWADVDPALDDWHTKREAIRQVVEKCAKDNKWTFEQATEETCDAAVFRGHLTQE